MPTPSVGGAKRDLRIVDDERAVHRDLERVASTLELPAIEAATRRETEVDARVSTEIVQRLRHAATREVVRGGDGAELELEVAADGGVCMGD